MWKYLRIAITALSLTACVLLIALWVRSYFALNSWQVHPLGARPIHLQSFQGHLIVFSIPDFYAWRLSDIPKSQLAWSDYDLTMPVIGRRTTTRTKTYRRSVSAAGIEREHEEWEDVPGFELQGYGKPTRGTKPSTTVIRVATIPHWALVITVAAISAIAASPSLSVRFSLRTLLIAMTLVAVGVAAIVSFVRY